MAPSETMTPDQLARACADAMWVEDTAARNLNVRLGEIGSGTAEVSMEVTDFMANGHGTCHGGYLFTLADTAFAYACNGHNEATVAMHCSITFLTPAMRGDVLSAAAREVTRAGRNGLYDVTIHNQDGVRIAEFRGQSRTVKGTWLPEGD